MTDNDWPETVVALGILALFAFLYWLAARRPSPPPAVPARLVEALEQIDRDLARVAAEVRALNAELPDTTRRDT
ncbi:hypothetical protein ABGB07_43975 [Micromonosporaceae bacterium B7E4]